MNLEIRKLLFYQTQRMSNKSSAGGKRICYRGRDTAW